MYFIVQWHITEQCNWRCTHCYHDQYLNSGPKLNELKDIFDQIQGINNNIYGKFSKKIINFAGGEPLIRKDFLDLLKYINSKVDEQYIGILTNGSLIDDQFLDELDKLTNLKFNFQISIEGTKGINDSIRGTGTYDLIGKKIELLKSRGFKIHLSFTLTNKNKDELLKMVPFLKKYDTYLGVRRLVPMGQSKEEYDLMLSSEDWYKLSVKISSININVFKNYKYARISLNGCSEITSYKYNGSGCAINQHRLLIIMDNLDIYSCRRLPIVLGSLKTQKLKDIFFSDEYMKQINSYKEIDICKKCKYYLKCKGGAKCITYAKEKTLKKEDPQCFYAKLLKEKK